MKALSSSPSTVKKKERKKKNQKTKTTASPSKYLLDYFLCQLNIPSTQ
jgi:hypothetical protein